DEKSVYQLKLSLIENCLYGVDIQPIAVQICKLRFFISLICEQEKNNSIAANYGFDPLPNLETKFVVANTLISKKQSEQSALFEDPEINKIKQDIKKVRHAHFNAATAKAKAECREEDKKLRKSLADLLAKDRIYNQEEARQLAAWNPYDQTTVSPFFDKEWMFDIKDGFDIVIGNPPYISTKDIPAEAKKMYEAEFGFNDDTYNLFTFKGLELTKNNGSLNYIIPKTFWTTQTKRNMRNLILDKNIQYIFDTANPFETVLVDTCIIQISNTQFEKSNTIKFIDGSENLHKPIIFAPVLQEIYRNTQNMVIFKPTEKNLKIWQLYGAKVKELYDQWWNKIETSKKIAENAVELKKYRESLKPGDIALLGCLTEGGQGLATGNNGKYIAIRKNSKWADTVIDGRPKKLIAAMKAEPLLAKELGNINPKEYLTSLSESEIAEKFDSIKEKYGRDIFGQGYIYKLIEEEEIADVEKLTDDEKENGIDTKKPFYVLYDKGDKDGNRWYLETPFAIAWSKENVQFLKTNSGKKGVGMPVVRNPQFNFKEGFCWNNVLNPKARLLKVKMKSASVNDVGSMSLSTLLENIPNYYLVCVLNSDFIFDYYREFINCTVNIQINDIRQIPIIIPTKESLKIISKTFQKAIDLK
ncbi:MAG: Eco57I restriction-modification methylase domain-containing protein, partial [Lachnoanaerobaculum gingivalis]